MKKIGFIDYYLDEWHANNYPEFIKERSGGEFEVAYAYGKIDSPIGGMTNKEWAEKYGVELIPTIEEIIEKSDFLMVLSPDNPEMHEELTYLPLQSKKLVYVDKTFAPDKETALKIFGVADNSGTKCFSSSALRFEPAYAKIDKKKIYKLYCEGPGPYQITSVHQIEPIVCLMGCDAKRVMSLGDEKHASLIIEFGDGRVAEFKHIDNKPCFNITVIDENNNCEEVPAKTDYMRLLIDEVLKFFNTGVIPVPHEQTVSIMAVRAAGIKAFAEPYKWFDV